MDAPSPAASWKERLERAFPGAEIRVSDDSHRHAGHLPPGSPSRGTHASVRVVSAAFEGMPRPERHRRVYAALGLGSGAAAFDATLHALEIRALAPSEAS